MNAEQIEINGALERKDIYWNNYCRKQRGYGFDAPHTRRARALYVQSLCRYYSLLGERNERQANEQA